MNEDKYLASALLAVSIMFITLGFIEYQKQQTQRTCLENNPNNGSICMRVIK